MLATALHHVLVVHVRCAEHGDLVHGHALAEHVTPVSPARGRTVRNPAAAHDGHEHCPAAAHSRADLALASQNLHVRVAAPGAVPRLAREAAPAQEPLDRAPKTSPPA